MMPHMLNKYIAFSSIYFGSIYMIAKSINEINNIVIKYDTINKKKYYFLIMLNTSILTFSFISHLKIHNDILFNIYLKIK